MTELRRSIDSPRFHQKQISHENSYRSRCSLTPEPQKHTANISIKNRTATNVDCRKPMLQSLTDHPNMSSMSGGSTTSTTATVNTMGLNSCYANENGNITSSTGEIQFDEREIYYVSPSKRKNILSASQTPVLRSSLRTCERFRSFSPTSAAAVAPSYPPIMPSAAYGARLSGTPGHDLSFDNYDASSHYSDTAMQVLRSGSCSAMTGIFNTNNLINNTSNAVNNCNSSSSSLSQQQHSQQQHQQQQKQPSQQTHLPPGQRVQNNVVTFSDHVSEQRATTPQNRGSLRRAKGRSSQSLCSCDVGSDTELNPDPSRPLYEYSLEHRQKAHTYTCEQNAQILLRLERERNRKLSLSGGSNGGGSRDDLENDAISSSDVEALPPVPPPPSMKRNGSLRSLRLLQNLQQQQSTLRSSVMFNSNHLNKSSNKSLHNNSSSNNNNINSSSSNNNSNNNVSLATLCSGDLLNDCAKTTHDVRAVIDDCTTSILKCANAMGSDIMSNTSTTRNGSYKTQPPTLNSMVSHSKPDVCHVTNTSTNNPISAKTSYFGNFPPPYAIHDDIILPKSQKSDPSLCFLHKASILTGMGIELGHVVAPTSSSTSMAFTDFTQSQRDLQQKLQHYKNSSRLSLSKYNTIGPSSDYARQLAVYAQQQQLLHQLQQTHMKPFNERCRCFSKSWSNFSRDLSQTQCSNDPGAAYRTNNHDNHHSSLLQQHQLASATLSSTGKGRQNETPLRSSLSSRSFNNLVDFDTYNYDMASILSSHHKSHLTQQNTHQLACNGVSVGMGSGAGGGGSGSGSGILNQSNRGSGLKDNQIHGQASLEHQQQQQHKLLQHHYQHEQLQDFHCNEHDNHHTLGIHGSTHLIKSSEKFQQHNHHHHHHHNNLNNHNPPHHSSLTSIMPWKHRQSPSRGSSSSGTNSLRFDAAKHWLAVSSILLIIGAASVAVPLALRVAASAPFEERLRVALQLLDQVPLIDGHNDLPWNIRKFLHNKLNDFNFNEDLREVVPWKRSHWSHTDLTRLKKGRISAQFWAAYVPCEAQHRDAVQLTLEQIDVIKRLTDRYSPQLTTCTSAQDIIEAHKNHQLCSLTGVEGGHSLGGSLAVLRTLYAIGVRYMTLTSTCHTPWADSSYADAPTYNVKHGGLTIFGKKEPGVQDSDYINASYVDSLLKPNAYIVTQGPVEDTVNSFWRLIWQENISAIIMLTKTFDFAKVMCVQYWPPNKEVHEKYGDIYINIVKEEQLANFHIRTFRLYKVKDGNPQDVADERLILQFHYTEWYSHSCPFSNAVLEFRRRVRLVVGSIIKDDDTKGPMLVHCSDGGGRSGVYLSIDANLELAEEEECFNVFGYLKKLRQSRKGLVENVDQYKFIYDTLEEHVVCGKTWFSVAELSDRLKAKARRNSFTKMNDYQMEYDKICKQTPRFTIGDCAGGHRADNREKNRDVLCVPPDNFRPYLTSFQGNAFTDYINSVFVDGYTKPREYIVTEWPMKHTLGEFWSLVYDTECSAVVVLCQPPANSQSYPSFWPIKSKMEKYGPVFSVHYSAAKSYTNIKQWEFKINKKIVSLTEMMAGVKAPTRTVQLFQLTCWPMGHKVPNSTNSLVYLMNMVEMWRAKSDYGPVCVVSPDGRSRAGVYCSANACIEQVIQHGEVDVFQAVKTVRRHRPQLVENITEYKYCYDLVLHYVLHFLNKKD